MHGKAILADAPFHAPPARLFDISCAAVEEADEKFLQINSA
jgi:hypothetical protein